MNAYLGFRSILLSAVVAGVFSTLVGAILVIDGMNRLNKVPLEATAFIELRQQFLEQPDNKPLRQEIQSLDLALRQEYFREQRFTERGSYLLLGGVLVTLLLSKWAATLHRRLPRPKPKRPGPDSDEVLSHRGPWAVAAVMLVLVGTTWAMKANHPSVLPSNLDELVSVRAPVGAQKRPGEDAVIEPVLPELPSAETMRANWPSFRGADGSGIASGQNAPTVWDGDSGDGILWKSEVPLPGVNSPIVWEDRVFLSGATEDARSVYCFDVGSGELLWSRDIAVDPSVAGEKIKTSNDTGYAAPTMATDGRFVFAMFADGQLVALDFAGREAWTRSLGAPQRNSYGHASSLVTYRGSVIVQYDQGTNDDQLSKLMCFDGATGSPIWETIRATPASWSSPIVIEHDGEPQIITCCDPWVIAYSPSDGTERWRANCLDRVEVGPSPVHSDGVVYAGNDMAIYAAIGVDGSGDVTDSHVLWTADYGLPDTCSPLVTDEFVLTLASYGTLFCFDKREGGEPLWEEDFGADFLSSPSLVGDRVYLFSRDGAAWVVEPTREGCKRISESQLGEDCVTSPAFRDGRIFIRGNEHLFCIGSPNADDE
ncbi:outer membrane biogenesis protein BamB [Stieleria neptunia]|uniref:Outer membrane biogenesis protein BamB n=1 Tax=Stieleria neptunia TaxID=2527979 RepID=A0A518HLW1_9BACT|nr:PQQ-binding-like beta-propeller repeat protein [Stieleria neptunia]QDV41798.1 outer membrane biogenesis protein BamB [Stieleria neptunia]